MSWAKSQDLDAALQSISQGLENIFLNPTHKAHLMHNQDGHPWIRIMQPMEEIRFIGVTPSRGTGPTYLKLRVFIYAEYKDPFHRLLKGKKFVFEDVVLSRGYAYPWGSWKRDLEREGRMVEGYEATLNIDGWESDNAEARLRALVEEFCHFAQACVQGGEAYDALTGAAISHEHPPWAEDQSEVDAIEQRGDLSESEREALVKLRVGQGWFRRQLLERWKGCAVTGCAISNVLVASHIVPWGQCDSITERWSVDNGLLLTPNLDKLFDHGLIGFDDSGRIIIGAGLSRGLLHHFGVDENMRLRRDVDFDFKVLATYLLRHREANGLHGKIK